MAPVLASAVVAWCRLLRCAEEDRQNVVGRLIANVRFRFCLKALASDRILIDRR